jgi:hypothetical protein
MKTRVISLSIINPFLYLQKGNEKWQIATGTNWVLAINVSYLLIDAIQFLQTWHDVTNAFFPSLIPCL